VRLIDYNEAAKLLGIPKATLYSSQIVGPNLA